MKRGREADSRDRRVRGSRRDADEIQEEGRQAARGDWRVEGGGGYVTPRSPVCVAEWMGGPVTHLGSSGGEEV